MNRIEPCKYEDWDDTTNPRLCRCSKYEGVDCANVPNDIKSCPDYQPSDSTTPDDLMLTDEEIWEKQQGNSEWGDEEKGRAVVEAQLAKFQPIIEKKYKEYHEMWTCANWWTEEATKVQNQLDETLVKVKQLEAENTELRERLDWHIRKESNDRK